MGWIGRRLKQLRALVRKDAVERELSEELAFHIEMETQHRIAAGMSAEEAHRSAHVEFGGVERYREQVREARAVRIVEDLIADVRYGVRTMLRRPGFTTAVVLTLGLGIGGTAAIFTVVDGLFLRMPDGVRGGEQVRKVYIARNEGGIQTGTGGPGSFVDYVALRDGTRSYDGIAAHFWRRLDLGRGAEAEQVIGTVVTPGYFELLGVRPTLGRFFTAEEDAIPGQHAVVVLSHGFWQSRFGGARDVVGRTLLLNGITMEVIGVAEQGFVGTEADPSDVWVPTAMAAPLNLMFGTAEEDWRTMPGMATIGYVARLADGVSEETAANDAAAALTRAAEEQPMLDPTPGMVFGTLAAAAGPDRSPAADLSLWLALVAGLVLIIACANVANLLLARALTRRRELAVRLSLGASRGRIARQHLTESLLLAVLGGAAGVIVAHFGLGLIRQFPLPPAAGRLDARLLGFTAAVSVLTGLLFGLLPALRSVRVDPLQAMKEGQAGTVSRTRTRRALVVVQVSLSLALLVGAGLFVRSLRQVYAVDSGYDHDRLLLATVNLGRTALEGEERELFFEMARQRAAALPFVESAAMVHFSPFSGSATSAPFRVPGLEKASFPREEGPYLNLAGPGFFATAGTRVLAGREFTPADGAGEPVTIVNQVMARGIAPDGNALGMCMHIDEGDCARIIGIVENTRHRFLSAADIPMIFLPRDQDPTAISWGGPALVVRTRGNPEAHAAALRAALQGLRSDLPFIRVQTVEDRVRNVVLPYRLGATLFSLFGVLALVLAAIGLNGVLGYFVAERTPEIGIRRSLGAPAQAVVSLVLRQGLIPVAIGLALGLAIAVAGSRFLASLLFGVEPRDPIAFVGAAVFLTCVALLATALPARRATRVDPVIALRQD